MPYPSRIQGQIEADELVVGQGVVVEPGVLITGKGGKAKRVVLGDFSYIGHGTRILTPEFSLGDYSKFHMQGFAHGKLPIQIGRNCWIGGNCVLDSTGGLDIDDNVGIGAQSQLWTHIQFGDIVEGSRFFSSNYMHVRRDAWFVGHCIVSPVEVGERSMALVGSVITRDMLPGRVYGGSPAKDITDKTGPQFEERTVAQKVAKLQELIAQFESDHPEHRGGLVAVHDAGEIHDDDRCYFDLSTRTYTKRLLPAEVAFLRATVPLVKFAPAGEPDFVIPQTTRGNPV
jgi:acetyltransferase-like isoleucine patch superfamily enzyme